MSVALLSLLFIILVCFAMFMQPNSLEFFDDANKDDVKKIMMSPALSQMLLTPTITTETVKPGIDALSRDAVVQNATQKAVSEDNDSAVGAQAVQWKNIPGSNGTRAQDSDCKSVGNVYATSLDQCKKACGAGCNLINYDEEAGPSCLKRNCTNPMNPSLEQGFPGSVVWGKSPSLNQSRKIKPKKKCPKCEVCPDMSKYIKLDEIPCWNCTLP